MTRCKKKRGQGAANTETAEMNEINSLQKNRNTRGTPSTPQQGGDLKAETSDQTYQDLLTELFNKWNDVSHFYSLVTVTFSEIFKPKNIDRYLDRFGYSYASLEYGYLKECEISRLYKGEDSPVRKKFYVHLWTTKKLTPDELAKFIEVISKRGIVQTVTSIDHAEMKRVKSELVECAKRLPIEWDVAHVTHSAIETCQVTHRPHETAQ
jgi:hypothetical protein